MPASHEDNCTKVCLICFKKTTTRPITGVTLERVKTYFLASYDPSTGIYPTGICANHRNVLNSIQQGTADWSDLPKPVNFSELINKLLPIINKLLPSYSLG